ncbi:hypothetical protein Glove_46g179 [Diversispora epigaea]|uniref:Ubiquitin-related modifier 1 n=1 Tax=Diversispora epigaea TaxID=1348612 RepID=A0A397JJ27_9GLOM|nr:hypothetical protein Glove_46g179 [Diversispora epigaea]
MTQPLIKVNLFFSGGLEILFDNIKQKTVEISSSINPPNQTKMEDLIKWIRENLIKTKPELFMTGNTIRPGILILINDVDWEVEGELEYTIKDGDNIHFLSTLHGG